MTSILKHENIGEIHGILGDEVVQFLGVKYATLKDRFATSQLTSYDAENGVVVDATRMG
jgi:carboxylesterase type B